MKMMRRLDTRGYTLVEIAVALLIIFIVLGGVYRTISRENIDLEREEIRLDMQNNARVSLDRIARAVRGSGFLGCSGELMVNSLTNAGTGKPDLLSDKTSADASDADHTWVVDPTLANGRSIMNELQNVAGNVDWLGESIGFYNNAAGGHPYYESGTDAITLAYLSDEVPLNNAMGATDADIDLTREAYTRGDILVVTDCEDYSVFQKSNCNDTQLIRHNANNDCPSNTTNPWVQLNTDSELGKDYGSKAQSRVFRLGFETFFVARVTPTANPELFQNCLSVAGDTDCPDSGAIATNIEDLQFEFYFDLDEDGDLTEPGGWQQSIGGVTFTSGAPVTSRDVRAVRIWVMARSEPVSGFTNTTPYVYPTGAAPVVFNDNRFRYLASTVIYIRNAGL